MVIRICVVAFILLAGIFPAPSVSSRQEAQSASGSPAVEKSGCRPQEQLSQKDFAFVMQTIREAWSEGNAQKAADCFSENALFSSPPSTVHHGRRTLYDYFGGQKGHAFPMKIEWHHLVFDSAEQIGAGEFTFQYHLQTHGVVIVKLSDGLISNWRQYDVPSGLPWDKFVGANSF